jgi:hypothetical protein
MENNDKWGTENVAVTSSVFLSTDIICLEVVRNTTQNLSQNIGPPGWQSNQDLRSINHSAAMFSLHMHCAGSKERQGDEW